MNTGSKILELILAGEINLFVKLAWERLLEAKISFLIPESGSLSVIAVLSMFGHQGAPQIKQPGLRES